MRNGTRFKTLLWIEEDKRLVTALLRHFAWFATFFVWWAEALHTRCRTS